MKKKGMVGKVIVGTVLLLIAVLLMGVYVEALREDDYHRRNYSKRVTISAQVTREYTDSENDRTVYVDYAFNGRIFRDVNWKTDNKNVHSVGDMVEVSVYPNGALVSDPVGFLMAVSVGFTMFASGMITLLLNLGRFRDGVITQEKLLHDLQRKNLGTRLGNFLLSMGAVLILNRYLMPHHPGFQVWGIGLLAMGLFLYISGTRDALAKIRQKHHSLRKAVCTSCIDEGDSDSSLWISTFRDIPGEHRLGHLSEYREYWLLMNEWGKPLLAYDVSEWSVVRGEDFLDNGGAFLKRSLLNTAVAMAINLAVAWLLNRVAQG